MVLPYTKAPHRGVHGSGADSPHAALLIDFDNVTLGMRSDMSKDLKALLDSDVIKGKVSVRRAYADWRRYPQYIVPLSEASVDLIFAPAYGSHKKNATDIRMAIDGMELVFVRPEIGTFILLTGDSDFSSLVLKLKEYGKYVIGVGMQESSSDILVQNCDEYYSYTSIAGLQRTSDLERVRRDPWNLVTDAVHRMTQRGDVMRSDRLKQVMREIDPGFSEGEIGFGKFSKFLLEAQRRGLVDLTKSDAGQFEVSAPGGGRTPTAGDNGKRTASGRVARRSVEATGPGKPKKPSGRRGGGRSQARTRVVGGRKAAEARSEPTAGSKAVGSSEEDETPTAAASATSPDKSKAPANERMAPVPKGRNDKQGQPKDSRSGRRSAAARTRTPAEPKRTASRAGSPDPEPATPVVEEIGPTAGEASGVDGSVGARTLRGGATRRRGADAPLQLFAVRTDRKTASKPPKKPEAPAVAKGSPKTRSSPAAAQVPDASETGRTKAVGFDLKELRLPTETSAMRRYLANRYRGVGEKTAEALVGRFGTDLFRVLAEEPEQVEGVIPPKRAEQLLEAWKGDYARRRSAAG